MFERLKQERMFWKRLRKFPNEVWGCRSGLEPLQIRLLTVFFDTEKEEFVFSVLQEKTLETAIRVLPFAQILSVERYVEKSAITKKKNPISRAVVGGVLAGGTGAVVGAISGQGEKTDIIYTLHLVFSYRSSSGESKEIDLVQNSATNPRDSQFVKTVLEQFEPGQGKDVQNTISKYERL